MTVELKVKSGAPRRAPGASFPEYLQPHIPRKTNVLLKLIGEVSAKKQRENKRKLYAEV